MVIVLLLFTTVGVESHHVLSVFLTVCSNLFMLHLMVDFLCSLVLIYNFDITLQVLATDLPGKVETNLCVLQGSMESACIEPLLFPQTCCTYVQARIFLTLMHTLMTLE